MLYLQSGFSCCPCLGDRVEQKNNEVSAPIDRLDQNYETRSVLVRNIAHHRRHAQGFELLTGCRLKKKISPPDRTKGNLIRGPNINFTIYTGA